MIGLVGAMTGFVWRLLDQRESYVRRSRDAQAWTAVIERIEADLLGGLAGDASIGAGIDGTATRLKVLTRGVWLATGSEGGRPAELAAGDLQGSEFTFDGAAGTLSARRFDARSGAGGPLEVVSERVERVRFRYFDGRAWRDEFSTIAQDRLPAAIEVAVWFASVARERAPSAPEEPEAAPKKWREPDRLRVMVVPDGPQAGWQPGGEEAGGPGTVPAGGGTQ